jgi:hypothetical protein
MVDLELNNKSYIGLDFPGITTDNFNINTFIKLLVVESAGLKVPLFEIHLSQKGYNLVPSLSVMNTEFKLSIGTSKSKSTTHNCRLYNYNYNSSNNSDLVLVLSGIFDFKDFTSLPRIDVHSGPSNEVLANIKSVAKVVTNYNGSDSQDWIQYNISDKQHVSNIIDHAYTTDNDLILAGLTIDGELIVKSMLETYKESPTTRFTHDHTEGSIRFDSIKVESDNAIGGDLLSDRILPVLQVSDRKLVTLPDRTEYDMSSKVDSGSLWDKVKSFFSTSSQTSNVTDAFVGNNLYPTIVDCGNCNSNYYIGWLININNGTKFIKNNLFMYTSIDYKSNTDTKLLDSVEVVLNNPLKNLPDEPLNGIYIITEKLTSITSQGYNQRYRLNRDYTNLVNQ